MNNVNEIALFHTSNRSKQYDGQTCRVNRNWVINCSDILTPQTILRYQIPGKRRIWTGSVVELVDSPSEVLEDEDEEDDGEVPLVNIATDKRCVKENVS